MSESHFWSTANLNLEGWPQYYLGFYIAERISVVRLPTPSGMSDAAAKKRTAQYPKFVEELPQMRTVAVQFVRQAVGRGRHAYVLVNNRAEGNAPLTVEGLVGMLRVCSHSCLSYLSTN
jgi:hypothetical protein